MRKGRKECESEGRGQERDGEERRVKGIRMGGKEGRKEGESEGRMGERKGKGIKKGKRG